MENHTNNCVLLLFKAIRWLRGFHGDATDFENIIGFSTQIIGNLSFPVSSSEFELGKYLHGRFECGIQRMVLKDDSLEYGVDKLGNMVLSLFDRAKVCRILGKNPDIYIKCIGNLAFPVKSNEFNLGVDVYNMVNNEIT